MKERKKIFRSDYLSPSFKDIVMISKLNKPIWINFTNISNLRGLRVNNLTEHDPLGWSSEPRHHGGVMRSHLHRPAQCVIQSIALQLRAVGKVAGEKALAHGFRVINTRGEGHIRRAESL